MACCSLLAIGIFAAFDVAADEEPATATKVKTEGLLLLRTGKIVKGRIVKSGDNYFVKKSEGEMFVPADAVMLVCKDLKDAYHKQREQIPAENNAEHHITLARWCLAQQMLSEARQELQDVLKLDPTRKDARDLLHRLDEVLDPAKRPEGKPGRDESSEAVKNSGFKSEDIESLAGLSRDSAQLFVRRIQPIVMNNCTLATCHAADADNPLRLQRVSVGGDASRHAAERNLAAVMRYVDLSDPRASRLLVTPKGNHGRRGRPVFAGSRGAEQFTELQEWVLDLARAEKKKNAKPAARPTAAAASSAGQRGQTEPASHKQKEAVSSPKGGSKAASIFVPSRADEASPDPQNAAPAEKAADPFDPGIFNRGEDRKE